MVGQRPVPILVNGIEQGQVVGQEIRASLEQITIAATGGSRTGWAVSDILQQEGLDQASRVTFTSKDGKQWSADPDLVNDQETRLIVSYSQGGELLLFSGPVLERAGRLKDRSSRSTAAGEEHDLVVFPSVVKIEVAG